MQLAEILDKLSQKLADITIYQRAAQDLAQKELTYLSEQKDIRANQDNVDSYILSTHVMHFRNARTGVSKKYSYRDLSIKDRAQQVFTHKNKQYSWLLAEAYEEFEDFLEAIYAYVGFNNNDFWLMSDFGNIKISDIKNKEYDWFLTQSRKKKDIPQSILNQLRDLYPELKNTEKQNKLNVDLRVCIDLISFLRHIIVHKSGIVDDREEFIKIVLQKSGVYNNGKHHPGYQEFIERFFGDDEYKNHILLLELNLAPDIGLVLYQDRLGELIGYLMSYAVEICKNIDDLSKKV